MIDLTINKNTLENIIERYDSKLTDEAQNRISHFLDNKTARRYYQLCIEGDLSAEEFITLFKIPQTKADFLIEMQNQIDLAKAKAIADVQAGNELRITIDLDNYENIDVEKFINLIDTMAKNHDCFSLEVRKKEHTYTKQEILNLMEIERHFSINIKLTEKFNDNNVAYITLKSALEACEKMERELAIIKDLDLSPFEKFLYVHDFVTKKIYNQPEDDSWQNSEKCRSFVNAMTSDYIVCAGYAEIMQAFLSRLGIECYYIAGDTQENESKIENERQHIIVKPSGHSANIVKIVDKKYNINGYYFCDACWDSKRNKYDRVNNYFYSALPIQDIKHVGQAKYFEHHIKDFNIPTNSTPIELETFRDALYSLYEKLLGTDFNKFKIDNDILSAIRFSNIPQICGIGAENSFKKEADRLNNLYSQH